MNIDLMTPRLNAVVDAIDAYQFIYANEEELQQSISEALTACGIDHEREYRLSLHDRIDFFVPFPHGSIGIEVKVAGAQHAVLRQLHRYALSPQISGLVLVTSRARHLQISWDGPAHDHDDPAKRRTGDATLAGKPIRIVPIIGRSL